MQFERGELAIIVYFNESKNETTQRTVIPTLVPKSTMKTIDVSELTPVQCQELQELYQEYTQYYEDFMANAFNFETWVEHTKGKEISPKWRAFKLSNIKDPQ